MTEEIINALAVLVVLGILLLVRAISKTERAKQLSERYGVVSTYVLDALFRVALSPTQLKEYEEKATKYSVDARVLFVMDSIEIPLKRMGIKVELEEVYNIAMRHLVERSEFPDRITPKE